MSDALCGPSNALQSFKQHASTDRTLQQDRLISRQQPGQSFRSHHANAGILDAEFEAFQAGPPSAFSNQPLQQQPFRHPLNVQNAGPARTGPSFAGPSLAGPSFAGPSQAPAWASDFQSLHISSPSPLQHPTSPQSHNTAWANQFHQSQTSAPSGYVTPTAMQYNSGPSYAVNRSMMAGLPQSHFMSPLQQSQPILGQKDDFDEAAFAAAFDEAMQDATHAQPPDTNPEEAIRSPSRRDIYPQLPLIRMALVNAIINGDDRSLHEAALFVNNLAQYDVDEMDPTQAMLLRPLITRLADQSRSPFAQRYQMTDMLQQMNAKYEAAERNAQVTPENEQLLAAYADCLWGRDQPDHPQSAQTSSSQDSAWRTQFIEDTESTTSNLTESALKMLSQSNLYALSIPQSMKRVQDLEVAAYRDRPFFQSNRFDFTTKNPQQSLLDMAATLSRNQGLANSPISERRRSLVEQQNALQLEQQVRQEEQARVLSSSPRDGYGEYHEDHRWYETDSALEEQEQEQRHSQSTKDDDELANTAADLLSKISHEKSPKFQNSAFLGLMRKLADREVKVEGDKMVETGHTNPATTTTTTDTFSPAIAPSAWSQVGPMQAHTATNVHPGDPDGQAVVDLLNQPDEITDQGTSQQQQHNLAPLARVPSLSSSHPPPTVFPSWDWADSI